MRIAICDDMPVIGYQTEELLLEYNDELFDIDVFQDPERLLDFIEINHYDVFFLDIEMPEMTGLELAQEIRKSGNQSPIVFLTSHTKYMQDVFKLHTFDYLVKPVEREAMFEHLDRLMDYVNYEEHRFNFAFNKSTHSLLYSEIFHFEKTRRAVQIHTAKDVFESIMTTDELLKKLDESFVQVHNSFIINARHFKKFSGNLVILANDKEIPVSRKFSKVAREKIMMRLRGLV